MYKCRKCRKIMEHIFTSIYFTDNLDERYEEIYNCKNCRSFLNIKTEDMPDKELKIEQWVDVT